MLEIRNLHARIEEREILKGIDLVVKPGEADAVAKLLAEQGQRVARLGEIVPRTGEAVVYSGRLRLA